MIIIAGKLYVDREGREAYLASLGDMIRRARNHPGCLDFIIAADPIEADRVNLFEQWESEEHLATWRAVANPPKPVATIESEEVYKHQISMSGPPFP